MFHHGGARSPNARRYLLSSALIVTWINIFSGPVLIAQPATKEPVAGAPIADVHHLVGWDNVKRNGKGKLTIQNGEMDFHAGKTDVKVPASSIEGVFSGEETTQALGAVGAIGKVAAPYGGGRVLSLLLRTKIDILTVAYRDANGGYHGVILSLPKGQAAVVKTQLVAAGAHEGVPVAGQSAQERKP